MDATTSKDTAANLKCHVYCVKDIFAPDDCAFPVKDGTWKPKAPSLEDIPEGQVLEDEDGTTSGLLILIGFRSCFDRKPHGFQSKFKCNVELD